MNRNVLKIIALITMIIDHIGMFIFPEIIWFRVVGRVSFPIYAFFIAQGMHYSKNKQRYMLTLFIFGVLAQLPYMFLVGSVYRLNIMFTFIFAGISIMLVNKLLEKHDFLTISILVVQFMLVIVLSSQGCIDYGLFGIVLIMIFYYARNTKSIYIIASIILIIAHTMSNAIVVGYDINGLLQIFSLVGIGLIGAYNNNKGKLNLKYFFYVIYPLHLYILWFIQLFI